MNEKSLNSRSLAQHRVHARRLRRLAAMELAAVVFLLVAMYFLFRDGLHVALKLICGLLLVSTTVKGLGDCSGYRKRMATIRKLETSG